MNVHCWILFTATTLFSSHLILVDCIDENEFDVKTDFNFDAPKVEGMDSIMSDPALNIDQHSHKMPLSMAPQPQNEIRDLSGWGIIGKMHPNTLIKDKLVNLYHNRAHDPRYMHLQGYGHLGEKHLKPTTKPKSMFNMDDKLFSNF